MAKAPRKPKPAQTHPTAVVPRAAVHLKAEELKRVDELRINIVGKNKAQTRPDVQSTLELMYLRVLSRVKNRAPVEKDLKELKHLLDQASAKMTEILDKAEPSTASK